MPRKPLPRSDAFLGVHFDFHARSDCRQVGKSLTPAMIGLMLDMIRPDYVQCDCKGHPGIASYPTKVGTPAPGFVRDPLRIWRRETAKRGVGLFMHFSGVWDDAASKAHPEWSRVNEKGKPDTQKMSVFGPYADRLLIPQLLEVYNTYRVDGAWIDGDCWAAARDYSRFAIERFRAQTGIRRIPRKPTDPHFHEFTEFCREGFRQYLRHYLAEMRARAPGMQIGSNWAFSSFMPEPVTADLPFLSGDYSLTDSYNAARLEARCLAPQGKPWDLMAWGFAGLWNDPCRSTKSPPQLQQEAACVLALGGGFQAYFTQNRDASIKEHQITVMADVARFCRARQFLHKSQSVPQIGLYYSTQAYYRNTPHLFSTWNGQLAPMAGVLQCLLDGQHTVDIAMDHHLSAAADFGLIVVPEWSIIAEDAQQKLLAYARAGGSVLLVGPGPCDVFRKELGIKWLQPKDDNPEPKSRWLDYGRLSGVLSYARHARLPRDGRLLGVLREADDRTAPGIPAGMIRRHGRGKLGALFFDMGRRYKDAATSNARNYLAHFVEQLFPRRMVEVRGSPFVDVTLREKDGVYYVSLINTAGPHADKAVFVFDDIPPVGPLAIRLRLPQRPRRLTLLPGKKPLAFTYARGHAALTLDRLDIHAAIAIET